MCREERKEFAMGCEEGFEGSSRKGEGERERMMRIVRVNSNRKIYQGITRVEEGIGEVGGKGV